MKTSARILAFSRDIGGAQALLPVLIAMTIDERNVTILASKSSSSLYQKYQLQCELFDESLFSLKPEDYVNKLIARWNPTLILLGSSPSHSSPPSTPEQYFTIAGNRSGVNTLMIEDFGGDYCRRFFGDDDKLDLDMVPNRLCVLDKRSRTKLLSLGVEDSCISITHNPWFDHIVKERNDLPTSLDKRSRKGLKILFVSQPLHKRDDNQINYKSVDILEGAITALKTPALLKFDNQILIWAHPEENVSRWLETLENLNIQNPEIFLDPERDSHLLANVDCLITSHSTVAYQALYYGTPCISYRPGDTEHMRLDTDELGLSISFTKSSDLTEYITNTNFADHRSLLLKKQNELIRQNLFFSDGRATQRVCTEIENLIDQ